MSGFVYVFKQSQTDYFKIGMTQTESIENRFKSFLTYSPTGGEIHCVIKTKDPVTLERQLHLKYSEKRMNGEFFKLNENDLFYLISIEDQKTKDLKELFYCSFLQSEIPIENIKRILNNNIFQQRNRKGEIKNRENLIFLYIEENLKGTELSNQEINNYLKLVDIEISAKCLGILLKSRYEQKIKSIDGKSMRIYYL